MSCPCIMYDWSIPTTQVTKNTNETKIVYEECLVFRPIRKVSRWLRGRHCLRKSGVKWTSGRQQLREKSHTKNRYNGINFLSTTYVERKCTGSEPLSQPPGGKNRQPLPEKRLLIGRILHDWNFGTWKSKIEFGLELPEGHKFTTTLR